MPLPNKPIVILLNILMILFCMDNIKGQEFPLMGNIPGTLEVTPSGQAVYSVPVEVVPGVNHIQPALSILYNSTSGNGLLGPNWDIGGLSTITCNQRNSCANFWLDGNRLIVIDHKPDEGQTVYGTETETFATITSYSFPDGPDSIPQRFTVEYDDGRILEYGFPADKKEYPENINLWVVQKISDPDGNYLVFNYDRFSENLRLKEILYTGNFISGRDPFARVSFSYCEDLPNMSDNNLLPLLKKIEIEYLTPGSIPQNIRTYEFEYKFDGEPYLISINRDNFNPTRIKWENGGETNLVDSIIDGMSRIIALDYKLLNHDTGKKIPPVVNSIVKSHPESNYREETNYHYRFPQWAPNRKLFLGFLEFEITDCVANSRTCHQLVYNQESEILQPCRITFQVDTTLLYQKTIVPEIKYITSSSRISTHSDGRFFLYDALVTEDDYLNNTRTTTYTVLKKEDARTASIRTIYSYPDSAVKIKEVLTRYRYGKVHLPDRRMVTGLSSSETETRYGNSSLAAKQKVKYHYKDGKIAEITEANRDGKRTTFFRYNNIGQLRDKEVFTKGTQSRKERYEYDPSGRFVTDITYNSGDHVHFEYDPGTGNLASMTGIEGFTTRYSYDESGRITKIISPDGTSKETTLHWCAHNEIPGALYYQKTTVPGKAPSYHYFDAWDREIHRHSAGIHIETYYNEKGEISRISFPYSGKLTPDINKIWKEYSYDSYGRLIREQEPYSDLTYTYDAGKVTIQDNIQNRIISTKQYDASGSLIFAEDQGGAITYDYKIARRNGKLRFVTGMHYGQTVTSVFYDLWGNRIQLTDPYAGKIKESYNGFGELTGRSDRSRHKIQYEYDDLGRVIREKYQQGNESDIIRYEYLFNKGKASSGIIYRKSYEDPFKDSETFTYDSLGRLTTVSKIRHHISYAHSCIYNREGLIETVMYPNNFGIRYSYDSLGNLNEIYRTDYNTLLYRVCDRNRSGQITQCIFGNGITGFYRYDENGLPLEIWAGKTGDNSRSNLISGDEPNFAFSSTHHIIQHYKYSYNDRGLMDGRMNLKNGQYEYFDYDGLERLQRINVNHSISLNHIYSPAGKFLYRRQSGEKGLFEKERPYIYTGQELNSFKPYMENPDPYLMGQNFYGKTAYLNQNEHELFLEYGTDQQRSKTILQHGKDTVKTKYFFSDFYEIEKTGTGMRYLHYIYGDQGIVAILVKENEKDAGSLYYIHTDYLGSYDMITDENSNCVDSLSFDVWGNRRKYDRWDEPDTGRAFLFDRGYTTHEHLDVFGLINMNARIYDPGAAKFFTPDPYIQMPDFTQSLNRYSYCMNNPLMYTDPDGELVWSILNAVKDFFTICFTKGGLEFWNWGKDYTKNAWKNGWVSTQNSWRLWIGLFKTDPNKQGKGRRFGEFVSRFTWQFPQTFLGSMVTQTQNFFNGIKEVSYYGGATLAETYSPKFSGLSLGNYIMGKRGTKADPSDRLFQHEYGHYIQSQSSGIFYLSKYGIPSALSKGRHNRHPVEQDVNARAYRYFSRNVENYSGWQHEYNPISGFDKTANPKSSQNQLSLKHAGLRLEWYDYVMFPFNLTPAIFIPGLINTLILNRRY